MKFVRNLILALALLLPGYSLAEEDSVYTPKKKATDYIPMPLGIEIGGGSMFVAGVEWGSPSSLIYVQERPKNAEGLWTPDDALIWILNVEVGYFFRKKELICEFSVLAILPEIWNI